MTLPPCGTAKGAIVAVRVVRRKGRGDEPMLVECTRCGKRWPLKAGVRHP
jgi:DNA-directed RNA polymerase subunit M/transcription elongation factor TFIIS